jgi:hypothetical protein
MNGGPALELPLDEGVIYPHFVRIILELFGDQFWAVPLVQGVLDSITCVFVAVFTLRWAGDRRAALLAGLGAAAYGPLVIFSGEILPVTILLFLVASALVSATGKKAVEPSDPREPRWLLAGALWATALCTRTEVVVAAPLLAFDAWRRGGRTAALRMAGPMFVVLVVTTALNFSATSRLVPLTVGGGLNFWLGNNPTADGVTPFGDAESAERIKSAMSATPDDSVTVDQSLMESGLGFWTGHPIQAIEGLAKKALWTMSDRELPNTDDPEWLRHRSWLFVSLGFGIVFSLALMGGVLAYRRRWPLLGLGAVAAMAIVPCLVFFTNSRFRAPLILPLIILAAVGVAHLTRREVYRDRRALAGPAGLIAVGLVLSLSDFLGVRDYHIAEIDVNIGLCEEADRRFETSAMYMRKGLAKTPNDPVALMHLALDLEQLGQPDQAIETFRRSRDLIPSEGSLGDMKNDFAIRHRTLLEHTP